MSTAGGGSLSLLLAAFGPLLLTPHTAPFPGGTAQSALGLGFLLSVAVVESFSPSSPRRSQMGHLPPLVPLGDEDSFASAHDLSRTANWLVPGRVVCGRYPGACPSRPRMSDEEVAKNLAFLMDLGVCTFVCLQDELPPQDVPWPEEGIPKNSDRAPLATGNFRNYRDLVPSSGSGIGGRRERPAATFVHYRLPDMSVAKNLNDLDEIVSYLVGRIRSGGGLYIHCWGGRGRTGLVAACLLGAFYPDVDAEEALERVQRSYSLRQPWHDSPSPETEEQRNQVREWFRCKRDGRMPLPPPPSVDEKKLPAYGIWSRDGTHVLEIISPTGAHPLENKEARREEADSDRLGNGRFGQVYRGRCENSREHVPVAIKVTYNLDDAPSHDQSRLALEAKVLRAMSGHDGFPEVLYDARQSVFGQPSDVLVMNLLGRRVLNRCSDAEECDLLCDDESYTESAVLRIGRSVIGCLRRLHGAGYVHNDLKPTNLLFGAQGSGKENDAHLVDFGMVTEVGRAQDGEVEGVSLQAGGAWPMFASLAQLEGRPTRPVDDVESMWYCLAFLLREELPWQWESPERLRGIKERLFLDECGIRSDVCGLVGLDSLCSTRHCLETIEGWDVPDAMHELWGCIVEGNQSRDGTVDYDACLDALRDLDSGAGPEPEATPVSEESVWQYLAPRPVK